jgi:restriction system protein
MVEVPDFQSLMRPVLEAVAERRLAAADLREYVAAALGLKEDALQQMLPSGRQTVFANRVAWANVYLQRAGCIDRPQRGTYEATERGRQLLREQSGGIDMRTLARFPEYTEWSRSSARRAKYSDASEPHEATPEEQIEAIVETINANLQEDLFNRPRRIHPRDFETMELNILRALGYGGGRAEFVKETPYAADGGVDGMINEDPLGLDTVYVQAKRYTEQNVGRPEVQAFVGTLVGLNAHKGILVTTSSFAPSALDYVRRIDKRVILIDGFQLARLMVEHNVAVRVKTGFAVKEIDENAFD